MSKPYPNGQWPEIINALQNGILGIDLKEIVFLYNHAAERILGLPAEDVIGRPLGEVLPDAGLSRVLKTGKPEYGQRLKLNNTAVISNRSPIFKDGKVVGAVGVFMDFSELKHLETELQSARDAYLELNAIIESSYDGIGIIGSDGTVLKVNSSYERITGLSPEDNGVGRNVFDLEREGHVSKAVALLVLQQAKPVTIKQKVKTGKEILITGSPVYDQQGGILRVVCNIRDLTELNNLKAQVEMSRLSANRVETELKELRARQVIHDSVIARSPQMIKVLELAQRVALVNTTVLITGESGVGKEVIAKTIHKGSPRAEGPFMQINCGAIPETLLESELFGYEPGAFTGAKTGGKIGIFELCNSGTLLLDEIGDLPLNLQVKILRVLQEQEVMRIGGVKPRKLDVRLLAATNRDLEQMISERIFRSDLFYRLNVVPLVIPPLRDRPEDIVPLALHFLEKFNTMHGYNRRFDHKVLSAFERYNWPGNTRELENLVERLVIVSDESVIGLHHLPASFTEPGGEKISVRVFETLPLKEAQELLERELLEKTLRLYPCIRQAARVLGVTHPTILRKVEKYQLRYKQ